MNFVQPVKRNLRFFLNPESIAHWSGRGPHFSLLLNTFSLFFPEGERFFIDSVRHFEDQISNQELKEAILSFIGQEALHGREHRDYNKALAQAGYPVERFEHWVTQLLQRDRQIFSKEAQLAITCALEHLTAVLAQSLLMHQEQFAADSDPRLVALWKWHALEETEHKAVAYDVYCEIMGHGPDAYGLRVMMFLLSNLMFWGLVIPFHLSFIVKAGQQWNLPSLLQMVQTLWGTQPGAFRKVVPDWLAYFRPDFHPWDIDNRHYLKEFEALMQEVSQFKAIPAQS